MENQLENEPTFNNPPSPPSPDPATATPAPQSAAPPFVPVGVDPSQAAPPPSGAGAVSPQTQEGQMVPQGANTPSGEDDVLRSQIEAAKARNPSADVDTQALLDQLKALGLQTTPAPTALTDEQKQNLSNLPKCEKCGQAGGLSVVADDSGKMTYSCANCGHSGQEIT